MSAPPHRLPLLALAAGAAVTAVTVGVPWVEFAYHRPSLHIVIETTAAVIALLTAYLLLGRFRESKSASDLALVFPLVLFGTTNLYLSLVEATATEVAQGFSAWAAVVCRLIAAGSFAVAAFVPGRRIESSEGAVIFIVTAAVSTFSLVAIVVQDLARSFPPVLDPKEAPPATAADPSITGHPALLGTQAVTAVLFVVAAVGFARYAARMGDEFFGWLAGGSVLAAFSALHYFLFPSLYSEWVYTGDFLRVGFYGLLLVGAGREISSYWRSRARAAVLEERRRLARELHDGLAQELAYIARQTRKLAQGGPASAPQLASAAERALDESRRAIAVLSRPLDRPFEELLTETAEVAAARVGVRVHVESDDGVALAPDLRDDLLRIASEAITNAGRHGGATEVRVELTNGDGTRLRVADNGCGFDPGEARGRGFGLASMRERAALHGGELIVASEPALGAAVEVHVP